MEDVLDLYAEPFDPKRPVVCLDEKSKQLLADSRPSMPAKPGKVAIQDYEYVRKGTRNIFVAVEPKAGKHVTEVTAQRKKEHYAAFLERIITQEYPDAECIRFVQDNLNIHTEKSLIHAFGKRKTKRLMERAEFHFTPKHASWLNMAEIEIGILSRQCLDRRIPNPRALQREVDVWQLARNTLRRTIECKFTRQDADQKLGRHYVPKLLC